MLSNNVSIRLTQLAHKFGLTLRGSDCAISGVASIDTATPDTLVCLRDSNLLDKALACKAGAIVISKDFEHIDFPCPTLSSDDPYLAFIRIESLLYSPFPIEQQHKLTFVHPTATVEDSAHIAPFVVVSAGCHVGHNVYLHPGTKLMQNVSIGDDTHVYPNAVVFPGCSIGQACIIGANTVIGGDGFGFHFAAGVHHKVPQLGTVRIGDHVEIGSHVSIDRGTFGETVIGTGTKIDNQVQIAHNVTIGKHVIIVAQAGISGSTQIGDYAVIAGKAGLVGHIAIGKGATIGGGSVVTKSVPDGHFVTGYPATEHREWKKQMVYLSKLPQLARDIATVLKKHNSNRTKE